MIDLRHLSPDELSDASALCIRSKAHWGYGEAFMAACVDELTLTVDDIARDQVIIASIGGDLVGVAQVSCDAEGCYLEKLFVDPDHMGKGVGRRLFGWSVQAARDLGGTEMIVEADPDAAPFYRAMACRDAGEAPSGSIPGRSLPRLVYDL